MLPDTHYVAQHVPGCRFHIVMNCDHRGHSDKNCKLSGGPKGCTDCLKACGAVMYAILMQYLSYRYRTWPPCLRLAVLSANDQTLSAEALPVPKMAEAAGSCTVPSAFTTALSLCT